jgi:hypothetical protein
MDKFFTRLVSIRSGKSLNKTKKEPEKRELILKIKFLLKVISRLRSRSMGKLSDNKWHLVSVWRSTRSNHELTVDSLVVKHVVNSSMGLGEMSGGARSFNLVDKLYVGGLKNESEYSDLRQRGKIQSRHGYMGCLASIEINGRVPDFEEVLNIYNRMHGNITKGCECKDI